MVSKELGNLPKSNIVIICEIKKGTIGSKGLSLRKFRAKTSIRVQLETQGVLIMSLLLWLRQAQHECQPAFQSRSLHRPT